MSRTKYVAAVIAVGVGVLGISGGIASGEGALKVDIYDGAFDSDPESSVRFGVRERNGERQQVRFGAKDVLLPCEDGIARRWDISRAYFTFISSRVFHQRKVNDTLDIDNRYISWEVRGKLLPGGKAEGWMSYDEYKPPAGGHNAVDCDTGGQRINWRATLTDQAER